MSRKKSKRLGKESQLDEARELLKTGWEEMARFAALTPEKRRAEVSAQGTPLPNLVDGNWISEAASHKLGAAAQLTFDPSHSVHHETWAREFRTAAVRAGVRHLSDENYPLPGVEALVDDVVEACNAHRRAYWHYFPAYLFHDEKATAFEIGPVRFLRGVEVVDFIRAHAASSSAPTDSERDMDELSRQAWVAAVEMPLADIRHGRVRAKRVVKLAVLGLAILLDDRAFPAKIRVADDIMPVAIMKEFAERDGRLFTRTLNHHLGARGHPGFIEEILSDFSAEIAWLGDSLTAYATGRGAHATLRERWLSALFWYGLGCDEMDDFAAAVNYGAALDTVLGDGNGRTPAITEALAALFKMSQGDTLMKQPELTLEQVVEQVYGEGRSRPIHGGIPTLSTDFVMLRSLGQVITRLALLHLADRLAAYARNYAHDDWSSFRRLLLSGAVPPA